MYITKGSSGKIKYIKKLLEKKGMQVVETICPEFIVTVRDPKPFIPPEYIAHLDIRTLDEGWQNMVKDFDCIKELVNAPQEFKDGTPVKIINGEYKDFTGTVIRNGNMNCDVLINVWGNKIIKSTIMHSDMVVFDNPFK